MPLNNKGFTLIEVLVSVVILFLAILMVNAAFKEYVSSKNKLKKYELIYISTLSLVNKLENEGLRDFSFKKGKINGLDYFVQVKKLLSLRNYTYGFGEMDNKKGNFLVTLYELKIKIAGHSFVLYKTRYKSVK